MSSSSSGDEWRFLVDAVDEIGNATIGREDALDPRPLPLLKARVIEFEGEMTLADCDDCWWWWWWMSV